MKHGVQRYGLFFSTLVLAFFSLTFPFPALAHFPATDKAITVILHVDPYDDPTPGKYATLYFDILDRSGKFSLASCECIVSVSENGKRIFTHPLVTKINKTPSIWGTSLPYIFPNRDIYTISLNGKPRVPGTFQDINLSWDFRVDQQSGQEIIRQQILFYGLLGLGIAGIAGGFVMLIWKRSSK